MFRKFREDDTTKLKNIWQIIRTRINERRIFPERLAMLTLYPIKLIQRGLEGEAAPITLTFLQKCVAVLNLTSGRNESYEKATATLTWDECIDLLKPSSAMPSGEGNFWERENVGWGSDE